MNVPRSSVTARIREIGGVAALDVARYLWALVFPGREWVRLCNRYERLIPADNAVGVRCDWQWTSELHAPRVLPFLGRALMKRALRDYPIALRDMPLATGGAEPPLITFVVGHRGTERLPHLLATLRSIAGQAGVMLECIVVEQSNAQEVRDHLPKWVRYIHSPPPYAGMPYCRSWAFNVAARFAKGRLLIFHDNDMLVPEQYAAELWRLYQEGFEVLNVKRFIFYLAEEHTSQVLRGSASLFSCAPAFVLQNLEAGGSLAVGRDVYMTLGGFDEAFVGWGGEDNEFWERAQTRRVWPFGYLPLVHLWHTPQPEKGLGEGGPPKQRYWELAKRPADERIRHLARLPSGSLSGPIETTGR